MRDCLLLVRLGGMTLQEVLRLPVGEFEEWLESAVELHRRLEGG